jgi:GT2 family glycosyltransferase
MNIAVIILNWNREELTEVAARSVAHDAAHIYLVDNGSRPDDLRRLRAFGEENAMTLIENGRNLGYGTGNNPGIARALRDGHDALLLMNDDARAEDGALAVLAERLQEAPGVGAVQPIVVTVTGDMVLHTTCSLDIGKGKTQWDDCGRLPAEVDTTTRPTGYLGGEALLARAEVFRQIGYFDSRYFMYFEDVDWSVRARRAGWELETVGGAIFRHAVPRIGSVGGAYHGARSQILFLRHSLGMSRRRAMRLALPLQLREMVTYARRGAIAQIVRGSAAGLASGLSA